MSLADILSTTITAIFLLIIIGYYLLLFWKHKPTKKRVSWDGITVIIPAHNEEEHLAKCIQSVLNARFPGEKQIIVVDDGSMDSTKAIALSFSVTVLSHKQRGKSRSINRALENAAYEAIAIIDADSIIHQDAFEHLLPFLGDEKVAIVCPTVKVANKKSFLGMWLHIEQLYNSLLRGLFTKTNTNIVAPGPLSVYKKSAINKVGGFTFDGYAEDVDIAVRFLRAGYRIEYASKSVTETYLPVTLSGFWRQRTRWAKGWINTFQRHLRLDKTFWQIYTLPLMFFGYFQAVVMGIITIANFVSGYIQYFASQGTYMSWRVLLFMFEWFSIVGIVRWAWSVITGSTPLTVLVAVGLLTSLLSYPLYILAIMRYDKYPRWYHIIPLVFMFPFWLAIMVLYIINLPEALHRRQRNIWKK